MLPTFDRNIFNEVLEGDYEERPTEFRNEASIDHDTEIIDNLNQMIKKAASADPPKPYLVNLWFNKLDEHKRNLRWNALQETAHGTEKRSTHS